MMAKFPQRSGQHPFSSVFKLESKDFKKRLTSESESLLDGWERLDAFKLHVEFTLS